MLEAGTARKIKDFFAVAVFLVYKYVYIYIYISCIYIYIYKKIQYILSNVSVCKRLVLVSICRHAQEQAKQERYEERERRKCV